jgi:WhiB family redox-sensing transcriptional regulator
MLAFSCASEDSLFDGSTYWESAACRSAPGSLTELFFSDEAADIELAKSVCATCNLVRPCLEGALARREPAGVWGGELFVEGHVVAFKRKRGRPAKSAQASPVVRGAERYVVMARPAWRGGASLAKLAGPLAGLAPPSALAERKSA